MWQPQQYVWLLWHSLLLLSAIPMQQQLLTPLLQ